MSGDLGYAHERFSVGVLILATHAGRIQERLIEAWTSQITYGATLMDGTGPKFPDDLSAEVAALGTRMTSEGSVQATVDAMTADDASEIARQIVHLDYAIAEALEEAWSLRGRSES
jgi:hypothetical protein